MNTTTDGTQLSPCVKLFIELLLDGASAVTSREVAVVRQLDDLVTHFRLDSLLTLELRSR